MFRAPRPALEAHSTQRSLIRVAPGEPPILRVQPRLLRGRSMRELAFLAGRYVAVSRPERLLAWLLAHPAELCDAFTVALGCARGTSALRSEVAARVAPIQRSIEMHLSRRERRELGELFDELGGRGGQAHFGVWRQGAEHTAARAGLLTSDDIAAAASMLELEGNPRRSHLVGDLIGFFTSQHYRALRSELGLAPPVSTNGI